MLKHIYIGGKY